MTSPAVPRYVGLLIAGLTLSGYSGSINWGGGFFSSNYSADGTDLQVGATAASPTGEIFFELGIFQNSDGSEFIPTFQNVGDWSARWVPLAANDDSITTASSDYHVTFNYFGNVLELGSDSDQVSTEPSAISGGTVVSGYRAYIWGFDTKTYVPDTEPFPEWFLATGNDPLSGGPSTSNWVIPDSSLSTNDTFDIQWDIASASVALVGRIDDNIGSGIMEDPGEGFGSSDFQFATVPEPSTFSFLGLVGFMILKRKRRAIRLPQ